MTNKPISPLIFIILIFLSITCLVIFIEDYIPDNKQPVREYNCSGILQYAHYNYTTEEVTYTESEHKVCEKIIHK